MDITTKLFLFFVFLAPTALCIVLHTFDRTPENRRSA